MFPSSPPPKPPISRPDLVGSVAGLALTVIAGVTAGMLGVFIMAFTDNCPVPTCNIDTAVTAIMAGFAIAIAVAGIGATMTIRRLVRRNLAWPFAVATLGLTAAACIAGISGYISGVGG